MKCLLNFWQVDMKMNWNANREKFMDANHTKPTPKLCKEDSTVVETISFLTNVELQASEPIARIEVLWPQMGGYMRNKVEYLYVENQTPNKRTTEEAAIRIALKECLINKLSNSFICFREQPYTPGRNPERMDLVVKSDLEKDKILLAVELKSDRASIDEIIEDWIKLKKFNGSNRKISIFAGFLSIDAFEKNELFFDKVSRKENEDYKFVRQVALQKWKIMHPIDHVERFCFIYIWAVDTDKENLTFDVFEIIKD